jgi:preprotein translocase SecE subunit
MAYKADQGRIVRLVAFWALALLIFYGCMSLKTSLENWGWSSGTAKPLVAGMPRLPILGWDFNAALLIAGLVFATSVWLLYRWQNSPKMAELLIDTESELGKVTWPTMSDAVNSSIVVMGVVVFLMAFLAGADILLGWWTKSLLIG